MGEWKNINMEYEMMISPFGQVEFKALKKKEAQEYFEWYVTQIEHRIHILSDFVLHEEADIHFDYSPESLIPLWRWYEKKIKIIDKTSEELAFDYSKYPEWLHNDISKTKISPETLKYGMDLAIYFAEVMVRNNNGEIQWGYFTKPKSRVSVNEPTLLGYKNGMDLNPRLIILNCTRRSSRELNSTRLYETYYIWLKYIK